MKEAMFYRVSNNTVRCELCPHMCVLKNKEIGRCRTRVNKDGSLMSMAYGNPCALHIDPIEKKPLYHFLPGTQSLSLATGGCNLSCLNCQNSSISQASPEEVEIGDFSPLEVVEMASTKACSSISFTYTDPTVYYEYMYDIAQIAHAHKLKNVMVSAGYMNKKPLEQLCPFIDAANIDLKCFDEQRYQQMCGIHLKPVLQTLQTLKAHNIWLEITNLIIPQYTDDIVMIKKMLEWLVEHDFAETPIHFNRFVPHYQLGHINATPVELLYDIAELALSCGMQFVYVGNVHANPYQNSVCKSCGQMLINRKGYAICKSINANGICENCGCSMVGVW